MRQIGLHHKLGFARIAHIQRGEIFGRGFVRHPDDAPAILGDLHIDALAHAAETFHLVLGQKLHVESQGL